MLRKINAVHIIVEFANGREVVDRSATAQSGIDLEIIHHISVTVSTVHQMRRKDRDLWLPRSDHKNIISWNGLSELQEITNARQIFEPLAAIEQDCAGTQTFGTHIDKRRNEQTTESYPQER